MRDADEEWRPVWTLVWRPDVNSPEHSESFSDELLAWRGFGKVVSQINARNDGYVLLQSGDPELRSELGSDNWDGVETLARFGLATCWYCDEYCKGDRGLHGPYEVPLCHEHWDYSVERLRRTGDGILFPIPWIVHWRVDQNDRQSPKLGAEEVDAWRELADVIATIRPELGGYAAMYPPSLTPAECQARDLEPDFWTPEPLRKIGPDLCFFCFEPCTGGHRIFKGTESRSICEKHWGEVIQGFQDL